MTQALLANMATQSTTQVQSTVTMVMQALSAQSQQLMAAVLENNQATTRQMQTTAGEQAAALVAMVLREMRRPPDPRDHGPGDQEPWVRTEFW